MVESYEISSVEKTIETPDLKSGLGSVDRDLKDTWHNDTPEPSDH